MKRPYFFCIQQKIAANGSFFGYTTFFRSLSRNISIFQCVIWFIKAADGVPGS
nr:MAG TPA: hypothetical protein [Caudoviricetes sp.]